MISHDTIRTSCRVEKEEYVMVRKIFVGILTVGVIAVLAGCNTVQGVGKDVSSAGHALEKASGK